MGHTNQQSLHSTIQPVTQTIITQLKYETRMNNIQHEQIKSLTFNINYNIYDKLNNTPHNQLNKKLYNQLTQQLYSPLSNRLNKQIETILNQQLP